MPRVGRHGAGAAKAPERVGGADDDRDLAEQVADGVASTVERCGEQQQDGHEREPQDRADDQHQPYPDRDDRLPDARHGPLLANPQVCWRTAARPCAG